MGDDMLERITRLEVQLAHLNLQDKARLERDEKQSEKLDTILSELNRYKGFIGGILFICGAIWTFVKMAGPLILKATGKE